MKKDILSNTTSISDAPEKDFQSHIKDYFSDLKKNLIDEDGNFNSDDRQIFETIMSDILKGDYRATAAYFQIMVASSDMTKEYIKTLGEGLESLENNAVEGTMNHLNVLILALLNKGIIDQKDLKFASVQHENFAKLVNSDKDLEDLHSKEDIPLEDVKNKFKEIENKAYQMTAIELGDIYDKLK